MKALYQRDDIDRQYEGGRGLASIEDSIDISIRRLEDCIKKSKERLITATRNKTVNIKIKNTIIRKHKCMDISGDK